ncbi:PREDICTED: putative F-box protein At5g52620 [Camelina sativa]|uniref:F-box protein At5g52620 n=1 Tax=Camelina sativa TaxID=90675 RepID=A0ABM1QHV0_CAMSA|nr:PREDICTED: putative F-box protein At5g52620 [Camelina sativa]
MEREGDLDPIPIDIIYEVLSRSCNKTIARFRFVSKCCALILTRPEFTELLLSRSSNQPPRILFATSYFGKCRLYSCPQPQNPDEDHSLVVAADLDMELLGGHMEPKNICGPVSGLLYFSNMRVSKEDIDKVPVICNPSTGQYAGLPSLGSKKSNPRTFLGYDRIGKQYKVLAITKFKEVHILTLGKGKESWRKIQCAVKHCPISEGICINGVLYYMAEINQGVKIIACFDVRYEKLWFLDAYSTPSMIFQYYSPKLINYKGKLGVICWQWNRQPNGRRKSSLHFSMWTLDDAQKQKWLRRVYYFPVDIAVEGTISVVGVTANGEIIMSMVYTYNPFFVFFFNPERMTLQRVEIQGFEAHGNHSRVYTFVDYAEDLKFI